MQRSSDRVIVVDFDGTITDQDVLDQISERFGDPWIYRQVDEALDEQRLTLNEVLRREFEPVRAPLEEVLEWVFKNIQIRPGFREFVEATRRNGWRLVVVSSGFRELIEPTLRREGIDDLEVISNAVDPDPAGWTIRFFDESVCDTCGQPCKRSTVSALASGEELVYVGDGYSDRCAAEYADLVFARRGLAAYLTERGHDFVPFEDFFEISRELSGR